MLHRTWLRLLSPLPFLLAASACGDDGDGSSARAADAYNASCTTARWSNTTDDCWACLCGACPTQLNACDDACTGGFECAIKENTLVNTAAEVPCEIRGVVKECLDDPALQPGAGALLAFDTCLIGAGTTQGNGEFRACETVCKFPYPGNVCQRYPEPPPAAAP
jgi:hypothetical protein